MIIHAVAIRNVKHERDEQDYLNRWGIHGWECSDQVKVNNGTKFIFKKEFSDSIPYKIILSFIEEMKKEASETKAFIVLKNKMEKKL